MQLSANTGLSDDPSLQLILVLATEPRARRLPTFPDLRTVEESTRSSCRANRRSAVGQSYGRQLSTYDLV